MTAYYNENDPPTADHLENLIADGDVSPGIVDRRDIRDVMPSDLKGFDQHHFFAGLGVWSYALRQAGWPDDRPIWTGSCPCQPFSASGNRLGFADERHLWPVFHYLISQHGPDVVVGEQVASADGLKWVDLVHADMEGTGFAFGALNAPAACVGAPEIRQRLYWLGYSKVDRVGSLVRIAGAGAPAEVQPRGPGLSRGLADAGGERRRGPTAGSEAWSDSGLGDGGEAHDRGPVNGYWRDADWLRCRDELGSWRPVRPGSFPLAHGMPRSMEALSPELQRLATVAGLDRKSFARAKSFRRHSLKGFGNAIVAPLATAFIKAVMPVVTPMLGWLLMTMLAAAAAAKQGIG